MIVEEPAASGRVRVHLPRRDRVAGRRARSSRRAARRGHRSAGSPGRASAVGRRRTACRPRVGRRPCERARAGPSELAAGIGAHHRERGVAAQEELLEVPVDRVAEARVATRRTTTAGTRESPNGCRGIELEEVRLHVEHELVAADAPRGRRPDRRWRPRARPSPPPDRPSLDSLLQASSVSSTAADAMAVWRNRRRGIPTRAACRSISSRARRSVSRAKGDGAAGYVSPLVTGPRSIGSRSSPSRSRRVTRPSSHALGVRTTLTRATGNAPVASTRDGDREGRLGAGGCAAVGGRVAGQCCCHRPRSSSSSVSPSAGTRSRGAATAARRAQRRPPPRRRTRPPPRRRSRRTRAGSTRRRRSRRTTRPPRPGCSRSAATRRAPSTAPARCPQRPARRLAVPRATAACAASSERRRRDHAPGAAPAGPASRRCSSATARTWVVFGAYDYGVHFLDAATGEDILPPFPTGDIIKGSVTVDPDGFPLVYTGSRDNYLPRARRSTARRPTELWKLTADAVSPTMWNDDWDGSAAGHRRLPVRGRREQPVPHREAQPRRTAPTATSRSTRSSCSTRRAGTTSCSRTSAAAGLDRELGRDLRQHRLLRQLRRPRAGLGHRAGLDGRAGPARGCSGSGPATTPTPRSSSTRRASSTSAPSTSGTTPGRARSAR